MKLTSCVIASVVFASLASVQASEVAPQQDEFFEKSIRPLLVTRCFECHAPGKAKGGLSLDSDADLLKGGDSGPAIVAGKPEESLLIEAVNHAGAIQMPPKQKLSDREIADLTAWIQSGARWPAVNVIIPLGNLFGQAGDQALGDALQFNEFKAVASAGNLGVNRVLQGWGDVAEIAPGVRFNFHNVGADGNQFGQVTNDAWSSSGAIQTLGKNIAENSGKIEEGIGMHANALVTFDLVKLRAAGELSSEQAFRFLVDRAGLNDTVNGAGAPSAYVIALVSRGPGAATDAQVTGFLNGKPLEVTRTDGVYAFSGELPAPLKADGHFAQFDVALPGDAQFLTLVTTGAGTESGGNTINSDHTVLSGARLEFATTSGSQAQLARRPAAASQSITAEQRAFWSFQPIQDHPVPTVQDVAWPKNTLDRFVLAQLEATGLRPVAAADRQAWIRRATFDLIGLPPTPEQLDAFVADSSADAYAKVVDRLLDSPHYGERWGRYWLDVARYGEDQAHTFQARVYPQGFRYRDWVTQAFNHDMPFDRFVTLQIAGDLVAGPDVMQNLPALGYFALGPVYYADAGCAPKAAADELDDRIDTLTRGFLGLTVSCARCHDHKFDPIPTQDYYSLAGIFSSTAYRETPLVPQDVVDRFNAGQAVIKGADDKLKIFLASEGTRASEKLTGDAARYILAVWKFETAAKQTPGLKLAEFAKTAELPDFLLERWVKALANDMKGKVPQWNAWFELREKLAAAAITGSELSAELQAALKAFADNLQTELSGTLAERNALSQQSAAQLAAAAEPEKKNVPKLELPKEKAELLAVFLGEKGLFAIPPERVEQFLTDVPKGVLAGLKSELEAAKQAAPLQFPTAHALTEGKGANVRVSIRGNHTQLGVEAPRRFLSIIAGENAPQFAQGSGRLELAQAIASKDNPLTARVLVNRVWQFHFGRGLVGTPSNFGLLGERPSHPQLLDYLASRFMAQGWSIKTLHREIMLSATYQLSTDFEAKNFEIDPENRLLWRMNRRRLDVEAWRDALLAVSGNLDESVGGPSGDLSAANYKRRTLYGTVSRHNLDSLLRLFDFPDPNITSERRTSTTVPLQQLFSLNSDFVVQQARSLAARVAGIPGLDDAARIRQTFLLLYGRTASEEELVLGQDFLKAELPKDAQGQPVASQLSRWEQYAQALLSSNEFTFVD